MKLLNIFKGNKYRSGQRGFTLIEILVVTGIFVILAGLGLFITLDSYRGYSFRSERAIIVSVLEKARSRAINNYYQLPHGVCYDNISYNYIIFHGSNYIPGAVTNETVPGSQAVEISGFPFCSSPLWIVFSQLTGNTAGATINITQNARTSTITINNEGRIDW